MIDRLVERELLIKQKSEEDSRRTNLSLTEKGKEIYEFHKAINEEYYLHLSKKLKKFNNRDFKKCIDIIKEITEYW